MYEREIFGTIQLAHHFHSAYTRDQVYQFLGVKLGRPAFDQHINRLLENSCLVEVDGRLYMPRAALELPHVYSERRRCSLRLFNHYRPYINRLAAIPWIQFIGLSGANSFESCKEEDDIDLFVITDRDRLWLSMIVIGAIRRIFPTTVLCLNYLIDEDHLPIPRQSYYTAIQIVQMIPIYNSAMKATLIKANPWIFAFLPNAGIDTSRNKAYSLTTYRRRTALQPINRICRSLNHLLFHKRYRHLITRQTPNCRGKNIDIAPGVAKLHENDHSDIYQRIAAAWPLGSSPS